jgi:hypothetical protein
LRIIKVVTDNGNAYYDIVSRLKRTHLRFSSISSGQAVDSSRDLVITSRAEAPTFAGNAIAVEDLDEDPTTMEGQLLSMLIEKSRRNLVVGIDPGLRIGIAVFYGGREIGSMTMSSVEESVEFVTTLVARVPHVSLSIKIGSGEPKSSQRLAGLLRGQVPRSASIEMVDESGTSTGKRGVAGVTKDQRAAAKIASRKGVQFNGAVPLRRSPA